MKGKLGDWTTLWQKRCNHEQTRIGKEEESDEKSS